ncbi:MAG: TetR/AcrR family transcriptional regulator [Desulfosudaceae bacterium]
MKAVNNKYLYNQEETTRDRILAAANVEFADKGFYRTVVSDIADRAGVGKGTVYRHFGNKEDLLGYLIDEGVSRVDSRIQAAIAAAASPVDALAAIITIFLDLHDQSRDLNKIIIMEGLQNIGRVQTNLLAGIQRIHAQLMDLFQKGIAAGIFIDHNPDQMTMIFEGLMWSILRNAILFDTSLDKATLEPLLLEICLNGFTNP